MCDHGSRQQPLRASIYLDQAPKSAIGLSHQSCCPTGSCTSCTLHSCLQHCLRNHNLSVQRQSLAHHPRSHQDREAMQACTTATNFCEHSYPEFCRGESYSYDRQCGGPISCHSFPASIDRALGRLWTQHRTSHEACCRSENPKFIGDLIIQVLDAAREQQLNCYIYDHDSNGVQTPTFFLLYEILSQLAASYKPDNGSHDYKCHQQLPITGITLQSHLQALLTDLAAEEAAAQEEETNRVWTRLGRLFFGNKQTIQPPCPLPTETRCYLDNCCQQASLQPCYARGAQQNMGMPQGVGKCAVCLNSDMIEGQMRRVGRGLDDRPRLPFHGGIHQHAALSRGRRLRDLSRVRGLWC